MQKISIRKLSILELVLLATSAVTAAVMPDKISDKEDNAKNGSLRQDATSDGDYSCVGNAPQTGVTCTVSASIGSTGAMDGMSSYTEEEGYRDTFNNTSLGGILGGDSAGGGTV